VELMMALEEAFHTTLDEQALVGAKTIAALERTIGVGPRVPGAEGSQGPGPAGPRSEGPGPNVRGFDGPEGAESWPVPISLPSWNRTRVAWFLRRISLPTWILPLGLVFMKMRVEGREHLASVDGPVVFASNHQSHMDVPAIFLALPARW